MNSLFGFELDLNLLLIGAIALLVILIILVGFNLFQNRNLPRGIKEVYQRFFKAKTPTFFKRIMYGAITIAAAPEVIHGITELINQPEYLPSWLHADWLKAVRYACLGAAFVSKFTVNWRETPPGKIPDVKSPIDAVIDVPVEGEAIVTPIETDGIQPTLSSEDYKEPITPTSFAAGIKPKYRLPINK